MNYKIISKKNPLKPADPEKFYPFPKWSSEMNLRTIAGQIARHCTLTPADVTAVLEALLSELPDYLMNGHSVRLGDFGLMKLSFSGEGRGTADDVTAKEIKRLKVLFLPGVELKRKLIATRFERID